MHVSRLGPAFSINILQLSPVMQAALPACGILSLLDNLKIDMIYGMKEMNGYKNCQEIMYSFKAVKLLQGRPVSCGWQRRQINGHLICGDIRKR